MKGFIRKDFAMIKSNLKLLIILFILYAVMGLVGDNDISFLLPFMCVMIMISSFSYDTYNKWDAYSVSFPNGRKNSVKAKYISTILLILIASIITIILSFIISYINLNTINYKQILVTMLGSIFGTLLVLTVMYPIIYKFGIEKARIIILVITFGLIFIGGFILSFLDFNLANILSFLEKYLIIILVIGMIIMVYVSYKISENIFLKKDFD